MTSTEEKIEKTEVWEGAGVASSVDDVADAVTAEDPDVGGIAASTAGLGLDLLGTAMNPLNSLAEAGVGWMMEHIAFLREPLDRLCGDPVEIGDRAEDWHALSTVLDQQGMALGDAVGLDVASWEGDAAQAYRAAAAVTQKSLASLAQDASGVADTVLQSGAMVGLERSLIRDLIASWLAQVIVWIFASVVSAGLALAAAIPSTVVEATRMALRFADTIEEIVTVLDEAGEAVAAIARNMETVAAQARKIGELGGRVGEKLDGIAPTQARVDGLKNLRGRLENLAGYDVPESLRGGELPGSNTDVGSGGDAPPLRRSPSESLDRFEETPVAKPLFDATADTVVEDGKEQAELREKQADFSEPSSPTT